MFWVPLVFHNCLLCYAFVLWVYASFDMWLGDLFCFVGSWALLLVALIRWVGLLICGCFGLFGTCLVGWILFTVFVYWFRRVVFD